MDVKTFLLKSATLLFLESQLTDDSSNSRDLIRTGIETLEKTRYIENIPGQATISFYKSIKDIVIEMLGSPTGVPFSRDELLQRYRLLCENDQNAYESLDQSLNTDYSESTLKRTILSHIRSIQNHYIEEQISEILNKAQRDFLNNRGSIKDTNAFIEDVVTKLDSIQLSRSTKDPSILGEVDVGSEESMNSVFGQVVKKANGSSILKTGWQDFNTALQGGFRRGEFWLIPALQHKYKTGLTLSLFSQFPRYNTPSPRDPNKKPLLLRISFEDSLESNMQFLYQYLKYNETRQPVSTEGISDIEMAGYVTSKLKVNGFHVKFIRADPTQWTYRNVCNKILELESQGYEIELLMLDYLSLVPTTGCRQGPPGTDMRDMFRRIRNFCAPRDIAVISPHQISTEAKMLLRAGTSDFSFVKEINEKGYYTDSKQLDQEIDGEVYMHIAKNGKDTYLVLMRGKHRISTILPDEYKYFMYKFPYKMPIPEDEGLPLSSYRKVPPSSGSAPHGGGSSFDF